MGNDTENIITISDTVFIDAVDDKGNYVPVDISSGIVTMSQPISQSMGISAIAATTQPTQPTHAEAVYYGNNNYGSDVGKFLIVMIGDGYTNSTKDQTDFKNQTNDLAFDLVNSYPYRLYKDYINIYRLCTLSNESGLNGEGGVTRDTYFNTTLYTYTNGAISLKGDPVYTASLDSRSVYTVLKNCDNVNISGSNHPYCVMLSNTVGLESGIGFGFKSYYKDTNGNLVWYYTLSGSIIGGKSTKKCYILRHEFGHSIGGLLDEYALMVPPVESAPNYTQVSDITI